MKRQILFVGDERQVLDGLRRSPRHHRDPQTIGHDEFDEVAAVHAASALVGELLPTHTINTSKTMLDMTYRERPGLVDQLRGWRDLAEATVLEIEENSDAA